MAVDVAASMAVFRRPIVKETSVHRARPAVIMWAPATRLMGFTKRAKRCVAAGADLWQWVMQEVTRVLVPRKPDMRFETWKVRVLRPGPEDSHDWYEDFLTMLVGGGGGGSPVGPAVSSPAVLGKKRARAAGSFAAANSCSASVGSVATATPGGEAVAPPSNEAAAAASSSLAPGGGAGARLRERPDAGSGQEAEPKRQRTGDLRVWLRGPAAVVENKGEVAGTAPQRVLGRATEGPPE